MNQPSLMATALDGFGALAMDALEPHHRVASSHRIASSRGVVATTEERRSQGPTPSARRAAR
jgi:hypothetical protein